MVLPTSQNQNPMSSSSGTIILLSALGALLYYWRLITEALQLAQPSSSWDIGLIETQLTLGSLLMLSKVGQGSIAQKEPWLRLPPFRWRVSTSGVWWACGSTATQGHPSLCAACVESVPTLTFQKISTSVIILKPSVGFLFMLWSSSVWFPLWHYILSCISGP